MKRFLKEFKKKQFFVNVKPFLKKMTKIFFLFIKVEYKKIFLYKSGLN